MSNENTNSRVSKATNVAENDNSDNDLENIITAEFIIISSNEQSEEESNLLTANKIVADSSSTKEETDPKSTPTNGKKKSSKDQHRRKAGPNAKMLELIKQQQEDRKNAELKVDEEAKRIERGQAEYQQKQQEQLRLEQEYREKMKEKGRNRIQRQREDGSYLTKEQRRKYQHAQIQLGAAGIQVPTRHSSHITTTNHCDSGKRRILYDDQRKMNRTSITIPAHSVMESKGQVLDEIKSYSGDVWEEICDQVDIDYEEYQILNTTEDSDDDNDPSLSPTERVHRPLEGDHELCESDRSSEELRAPVICVLGHVDAGKTTLLDNLRRTQVQAREANGITQQIGATNVPLETIDERVKMCRHMITQEGDLMIPGLLIIDTPGHETFKNLRSRGSSLCDLAILVVDIMHGLSPQTIESIELLKERKTPFIVALNKVDLLYGWQGNSESDIELVCRQQSAFTQNHFEQRCNQIIVQFAEQWLNVALYYKNSDPAEFYSMVPVSARSGDGMGSLIALIIEKCQTSLAERLTYTDELQATVMEVKKNDDFGTTIDVVLVNGCLSVGDRIIIAGQEAPIVTRIRELLIPESNQELRVTNQYQKRKKVKGACGMKILAHDLDKAMAGLPLFVARQKDDIDYFQNEIEGLLKSALNSFELKDTGVYVQASTLGSLEAFLQLLKTSKIPYAGINIGPVHRKDVIRASTQLEKGVEWATILAFDVKIERDAQEHANTIGVKILQSDEIYRLHDMFKLYREEMTTTDRERNRRLAVFPCKLKILSQYIFKTRDPIICGVRIEDGFLRLNTPICIPSRDGIDLGRIVSIEKNHKSLETAPKGTEVCIKIEPISGEVPKMYGRHFDENDLLVSRISRESIDIVKAYFRDDMQSSDWKLVIELKKVFQIV